MSNADQIREAIEVLLVDMVKTLVAEAFDYGVQAEPGTPVHRLRLLLIEGVSMERYNAQAIAAIKPLVDPLPPPAANKPERRARPRCTCRQRDAERCAADLQLTAMACSCDCHRRGSVRA